MKITNGSRGLSKYIVQLISGQSLREYCGISKEIVSIGVAARIEIWSKENWANYNSEDNTVDSAVAIKMAELGI